MPDEDKNFGGSLVLDFRKWWRHVQAMKGKKYCGGIMTNVVWVIIFCTPFPQNQESRSLGGSNFRSTRRVIVLHSHPIRTFSSPEPPILLVCGRNRDACLRPGGSWALGTTMPIGFVRFDPKRAHSDGKFEDRELPVVGLPRGRGSLCWAKVARRLGTRKEWLL